MLVCVTHAQRRPGFEPRRHDVGSGGCRVENRSTKAGVRTPATQPAGDSEDLVFFERSTKAGVRTPATPAGSGTMRWTAPSAAQRRPGFEPRRHFSGRVRCLVLPPCIAQRRPGFEPRRHEPAFRMCAAECPPAQRRPGFEPRRHGRHGAELSLWLDRRSTKAGVRTPATPVALLGLLVALDRSTKAGVRTPATPTRQPAPTLDLGALNEGRGSNPGDTAARGPHARPRARRSTKAGVRTPATLRSPHAGQKRGRRSTKAGVRTPATLAHARPQVARPRVRSTKAGVRTPATRVLSGEAKSGKSRSTKAGVRTPATQPHGHEPLHVADGRSTKAGVRTPATQPDAAVRSQGVLPRSTKAGVRTPATHSRGHHLSMRHAPLRSTKAGVRTPATRATGAPWPRPP